MEHPRQTRPALIIIDMINTFDFNHGQTLAKKALEISKPINRMKKQFNKMDLPVIYVNDHYNLWQANIHTIVNYCMNPISKLIINEMLPTEKDYFLIKPKHSAFYGTALNTLLHQLKANTLIMCGIAGNICVLFSANDAYMREYKLFIPEDCIASNDDNDNQNALKMMKNILKADTAPVSKNNYIISSILPS